ncbi:hypothetical protein MSAN_00556000 [Mycena sanguinolenta]|uniref:Uncharacterized protein n=1 Tax=Mycena sanguinolenta TaxID=230812 RepID=A0A8H6Z6Y9_9AGAR|nr:hypothetical protein MSAN_00556000 [Mycena sanguinolenta]
MFLNLGLVFRQALALCALVDAVYGQTPTAATYDPSPFNYLGTIDSMTLNVADGPLAGGTITVNNLTVIVPKNTLITLPSITVAWSEMFAVDAAGNATPQLPLLGTVSWEANVFGNVVGGEKIAGLIFITQEFGQILQGFITEIDYDTGHFWVGGDLECVLNDPLGRFGLPYTGDPLWTVDPDNPSIHTSTGVPMCIPRNTTDSECPLTNRPTDGNGNYLTTFNFPDPALVTPGGLDPRIMVPLVVGDWVLLAGTKVKNDLLEVYTLTANLGIYTAPGTKPAYVTVEAAQYAIVDPDPTVESGQTRATAVASDPTIPIQWFAMDVDPCTGEVSERDILLAQPEGNAPIGLTTFRLGKTDVSPATRNVGFRYTNGIADGPKGIIAGQFIQPVMLFIFPELISFGAHEIPNQFDEIPFLAMGSGLLEFGNLLTPPLASPTIVGQLDPWPGATLPATTSCPPPSTSSTSTSTSSAPTSSPTGTPGIIEIITATAVNQQGVVTCSVEALTTDMSAQLFMQVVGIDNTPAEPMDSLGNGIFELTIAVKGKPTEIIITSDDGATPIPITVVGG